MNRQKAGGRPRLHQKMVRMVVEPLVGPLSSVEAVSVAIGVISLLSLLINSAYLTAPGPVYMYGTALSVWLTSLLCFFCIQVFNNTRKSISDVKRFFGMQLTYYGAICLGAAIIALGYALGGQRPEGALWGVLLLLVASFNMIVLVVRYSFAPSPQYKLVAADDHHRRKSFLSIVNTIILLFSLVFLLLLCNGAIVNGQVIMYPPRGQFVTVQLEDGSNRMQTIHYLCAGPKSDKPVFMIEADGSHGLPDFYGMQAYLAQAGRRSCIWDKPGLGWSDCFYADQGPDPMTFYHNMITGFGEEGPFIFVGWGGGGEIVYEYAVDHPEIVSDIVFLDAYGSGAEWRAQQYLKNLTEEQLLAQRQHDLSYRNLLFGIIRNLGTPWGIMSLAVAYDPVAYYPPELYDEYRMPYLLDKTWTTQSFYLRKEASAKLAKGWLGAFERRNANLKAGVVMIRTKLNDTAACRKAKLELDSIQCANLIQVNHFMQEDQLMVADVTGRSRIIDCSELDCSQDMPIRKAKWVVDQIVSAFP